MTILSAALLLFLILDPLGNVPVFLSVLKPLPPHRQRVVLVRELLIALAVLMAFLWGGKYALELMHLRQESVAIAGGIVLFLIGIRMIFPRPEGLLGELPDGEPFIVPLAIPLIAGPSGMAAGGHLGADAAGRAFGLPGAGGLRSGSRELHTKSPAFVWMPAAPWILKSCHASVTRAA